MNLRGDQRICVTNGSKRDFGYKNTVVAAVFHAAAPVAKIRLGGLHPFGGHHIAFGIADGKATEIAKLLLYVGSKRSSGNRLTDSSAFLVGHRNVKVRKLGVFFVNDSLCCVKNDITALASDNSS